MHWKAIKKTPTLYRITPHLLDYEETCAHFSWETIGRELNGLPGGKGLNIAHEAVDRHANTHLAHHPALRWLGPDGTVLEYTYTDLQQQSNRFANVLRQLGVGKGDAVFVFADRIPALYFAALGSLKNGSIFCPLFSAFGPEPVYQRLQRGHAKVLVTTTQIFQQKVEQLRERLPQLQHILLIDASDDLCEGHWSLPQKMMVASEDFTIEATDPEDPALLHFTSGTTGMPKGALHVHKAVFTHYATGKFVLDFHPDDIFWCTADPGWVTGMAYGIIAPLVAGITCIIDSEPFNAERWYKILEREQVSIWYTSPTAIRRLMRLDIQPRCLYDLRHLRAVHSVGEPLNPEAVIWGQDALGTAIHDNWWQTETGGIMIANYLAMEIRPGSMGRPLPGIQAAVIRRQKDHSLEVITEDNVEGELALQKGWPSMFRAYVDEDTRYRKCFVDQWYLTGDIVRRDGDGYFWFVGRADDIIKTAGHMVSPFEVESTLMAHPAVAEAGVIGKPDVLLGEMVKAFVALKPGTVADDQLRLELIGFTRRRLGPAVAPREIEFQNQLPKNRAGKIMRRLLKDRELGMPEGDVSTMETENE
ncbi:acetate--CoA ligase [Desulfogranum marinum]|uniref:acetate--CoA ligase n=1 Tax=Desulfogranum marinum TaxID=453220 RepID=UPI001962B553|nr:acetate--CoA ligase [Desulfogranum marinum]